MNIFHWRIPWTDAIFWRKQQNTRPGSRKSQIFDNENRSVNAPTEESGLQFLYRKPPRHTPSRGGLRSAYGKERTLRRGAVISASELHAS